MKLRSYFIFLGSLGLLAFFPLPAPFSSSIDSNSSIRHQIPLQVDEWTGVDIPLDAKTYQILETRNVLLREYKNPGGKSVQLLIVSSDKDRRVAHPPEVCFITSNYLIVDERVEELPWSNGSIKLKRFVAHDKENPTQDEKVMYVYKVGNRFTSNYYKQQLFFAWDRATRRESQILLIRVSGPDEEVFKEFLLKVLAHLPNTPGLS